MNKTFILYSVQNALHIFIVTVRVKTLQLHKVTPQTQTRLIFIKLTLFGEISIQIRLRHGVEQISELIKTFCSIQSLWYIVPSSHGIIQA